MSLSALADTSFCPTDSVLYILSTSLGRGDSARIPTPFGVMLTPARGRYAVGQHVAASGIDECSPCVTSMVMAVGTRDDYPGIWYLVRELGQCDPGALVSEEGLRSLEVYRGVSTVRRPLAA